MPIPLSFQISEFDCGPACLMNALNVLFDRRLIRPCLIKAVYQYTLDRVDAQGNPGNRGTSAGALVFFGQWLNNYRESCNFPAQCRSLPAEDIRFEPGSPLLQALEQGAVAVLRVRLMVPHYVLVTGIADGWAQVWDPYFVEKKFKKHTIKVVGDAPCHHNRLIRFDQLNALGKGYYNMGDFAERECLVIRNIEAQPG